MLSRFYTSNKEIATNIYYVLVCSLTVNMLSLSGAIVMEDCVIS